MAATPLPSGTATFVMTDVVGSTPMWEADPAAAMDAFARHEAIMSGALDRSGGVRPKDQGEGDSVFAVFASPDDAVAFVVDVQREIAAEPWPAGAEIRVRAAVHSGEALIVGDNFKGSPVHRCARLRGLAHGGQIVVSEATARLVEHSLPTGVALRDLGSHELRGLREPERVFQLDVEGLDREFPPLLSAGRRHNIGQYASTFVGRDDEYEAVSSLLTRSRLVTLVGPGGTGKTRLATEVAAGLVNAWPDGVWLVELAALAADGPVAETIAAVLKIAGEAERPMLESLVDALRDRRLLLVLDNCEHVVDGAAKAVDRLLRDCPSVVVLATSRTPFAITGEQVYRLAPLTVAPESESDPARLVGYDAVALFVQRATAVLSSFELTTANAAAVAAICRRLDGIPLAIELAAARVAVLSPVEIVRRLDDRFRLLTSRERTAAPRQQTLRALIDWSYELLSPRERLVFPQLSVFAGSFDLEAAEAVVAASGIDEWEILDSLQALVEQSLVESVVVDGSIRYRLLDTIREYARSELARSDSGGDAPVRHRAHYLSVAEDCDEWFRTARATAAQVRLDADYENVRRALVTSIDDGDVVSAQRLASALYRYWFRCRVKEGIDTLEQVIALSNEPTLEWARVCVALGGMLAEAADSPSLRERARQVTEQGRAIALRLGADSVIASSALNEAWLAYREGDANAALQHVERARDHAQRAGDEHDVNGADVYAMNILQAAGDVAAAEKIGHAVLQRTNETPDSWSRMAALNNLAVSELRSGALDDALAHVLESLDAALRTNDHNAAVAARATLICVRFHRGDVDGIAEIVDAVFDHGRAQRFPMAVGMALVYYALLATRRGELEVAATLHGAAEAVFSAARIALASEPNDYELQQADQARLRDALGEARFDERFDEGRRLTADEAVALARTGR